MCSWEILLLWDFFQSTTHLIDMLTAAGQHWGHLPAPCLGTVGCSQAAVSSASTIQHAGSWDRRAQQCKYAKCRDYLVETSTKGWTAIPFIAGNRILKFPLKSHRMESLRDTISLWVKMWFVSIPINISVERLWRISFFPASPLCLTSLCV